MYTCLTHAHGGRGGTVHENVINVSVRLTVCWLWPAGSWLEQTARRMQGTTRRSQLPCDCRRHHATVGPTAKPRSAATTPCTVRQWRSCAPWRRLVVRGVHPPSPPARPPARRRVCACGCVVLACAWACCGGAVQRRACTDATTAVSLRGSCSPQVRPRRAAA